MGTLHVVATPIGHLEDVTLRALRVLREADLVYAEDTRRTRVLLDRHGIASPLASLHAHNEQARVPEALAKLAAGAKLALVSDAGTPAVSDPGGRLIAAAAEAGHEVCPIPGPSALLAALAACGLRAPTFAFLGFPPRRPGPRRALFTAHAASAEALVLYESPARVGATLADLAAVLGAERRACVARELTKLHEELVRGTLGELAVRFAGGARGEITLVVEGARGAAGEGRASIGGDEADESDPEALDRCIEELAASGLRTREIAAELAERTGRPRRELYARAAALTGGAEAGAGDGGADAEAE